MLWYDHGVRYISHYQQTDQGKNCLEEHQDIGEWKSEEDLFWNSYSIHIVSTAFCQN